MNKHPEIQWLDGRPIVTCRVFPNLPESPGFPDWSWAPADWDLGDPAEGYFQTEQEALEDARETIEALREGAH